jgi:thiol-disulfide isomerase/thioredoxin
MKIAKISAFAFALVFSAGFAMADGADCPMACADATKQVVAAAAEKAEGCGSACVCPTTGKTVETIAEAGADTRSIPGGGVEVRPAGNDTTTAKGYRVGSTVENFSLKHAQTGNTVSLSDLAGEKATVVIFWNQNCPYVEGGPAAAAERVAQFASEYAEKGVKVVAIDAGVDKPEEDIVKYAADKPFPILLNPDSTIAVKFDAQYTPHTFVLDSNMNVVYEGGFDSGGRLDENGNVEPWTRNAVNDVLAGGKPAVANRRGIGCTIKWAKGARPTA